MGREHFAGKTLHDRTGLDMEVAHHGIGLPATKKLDNIGVNFGAQKSHGAPGTEGPGRNFGRKDAKVGTGQESKAKGGSDVGGGDMEPVEGIVEVRGNGVGGESKMVGKVADPADGGHNRADKVMATAAVVKDLATNAVLLIGEGKGDIGGGKDVLGRGIGWKLPGANEEGEVAQAKRAGDGGGRGGRGVFARSEKEEKGQDGHVDDGMSG